VYFVEKIKASGSVRNQVTGGFPIYRSISTNVAWKRKPSLCHPERSRATVCFVKRVRVGLVVEKAWTGPTWETRLRFPLSPNAAAAGVFKKVKQQQVAPL
jgi:hypothetical protein